MIPLLYFVIPCFNDEHVLPYTIPEVLKKTENLINAGKIADESRIVLINDGSKDDTWHVIKNLCETNSRIAGVNLSHNFGEQNALMAGLSVCRNADCIISMDSDLQDDIEATGEMLTLFAEDFDVVLGVRTKRPEDSLLEKFCSEAFYSCMKMFGTGLARGHSNFRLLSKAAVNKLLLSIGDSFFLPARVCSLGLPTATVAYVRKSRLTGVSGYSFKRKLQLGVDALMLHSDLFKSISELSGAVKRNMVSFEISEITGLSVE